MSLIVFCLLFSAYSLAGTAKIDYQQQVLVLPSGKVSVRIPVGMQLELLTDEMNSPRLLTFIKNGDLFAGSRSGNVYRITPPYTRTKVLISTGGYPHNVAFRDNEILIATTDALYRAPYRLGQNTVEENTLRLVAKIPGGGGHNSRTVGIGPDKRVYLSLGIAGNCSNQYLGKPYPFTGRRGGVVVLDESGKQPQWQTFASGLRNPVGFDWHPDTGVMYASNNGPDHLGFDLPPEYFSRLEQDTFMGMPWFQYDGKVLRRDGCMKTTPPLPASEVTLPVATFPARNAPMGVHFIPAHGLDARFTGDAIVALKGSWGTQPSGGFYGDAATRREPKLVVVRFKDGEAQRVDDLVTGFQLEGGSRWARPVGLATGPDGALYFTSDSGVNGLFRLKKIAK
ncbi:MAG: PQQ-dependent sugar dehydrogenase [Sulfuriflexus sp.]|nr:PQQ-dependent sugar dehydrogenase [Sulfuriflexus sp.]